MTPQEFLNLFGPAAQKEQQRSGLPASLLLAQMIQESGFKLSELASKYNNPFGIKADKSWKGKSVAMTTTEEVNGVKVPTVAYFRVYDSLEQAFAGRTEFFQQNPRYSELLKTNNPYDGAKLLQKAGYATDSNYANSLISLINKYNLTQYDTGGPVSSPASTPDSPSLAPTADPNQNFFQKFLVGVMRGTSLFTMTPEQRQTAEEKGIWDSLGNAASPENLGEFVAEWGNEAKKSLVVTGIIIAIVVVVIILIIISFKGGSQNGGYTSPTAS